MIKISFMRGYEMGLDSSITYYVEDVKTCFFVNGSQLLVKG